MKARKYAAIILFSLCGMGKSFANEIVDAMLYFPTPSMDDFLKESCSKKIFTSREVSFFLDNTFMYASDHGAPAEFYMGVFSVKSKIKTKEFFLENTTMMFFTSK